MLILGGLSVTDNDESLSVCELKFTNSSEAPSYDDLSGLKIEELKEQPGPTKKKGKRKSNT